MRSPISFLRACWRISLLLLHVGYGLLALRCYFPYARAENLWRYRRHWSRLLLRILKVELPAIEPRLDTTSLVVCNHISWLDIFVISACIPAHFVCKIEIRRWPVIGWLVAAAGTVFIDRSSRAGAARTMQALSASLKQGESVVFFPEGTTTDGSVLLPFNAALFEAASLTGAPVSPLSLRYLDHTGQMSLAPAYVGDVNFFQCVVAIARAPLTRVRFNQLPALPGGEARRSYAARCEQAIAQDLQVDVMREDAGA
ncbi:lysophospholipid acyltransferase family protein [Viridibacterium curvum]|uniref:1-acyl-sn-glycerol-3-phosphate acyltransferase n=1 Tax=Viridibacterium curvum TaxID=1101404 RepID=A0ABP9R8B4_9RHOO